MKKKRIVKTSSTNEKFEAGKQPQKSDVSKDEYREIKGSMVTRKEKGEEIRMSKIKSGGAKNHDNLHK